jgi:hypothetical protein
LEDYLPIHGVYILVKFAYCQPGFELLVYWESNLVAAGRSWVRISAASEKLLLIPKPFWTGWDLVPHN